MKSSRYPIWKRLASLLLVLTLFTSSSGFAAFAEEFLLEDEETAQTDCEPALFDELLKEEAEEGYLPAQGLPRSEDESPADTAEADAQEQVPESARDTLEAAPALASSAAETAVPDAQLLTEAVPGTVRLAAGEELFPVGTSLSVTPLTETEGTRLLKLAETNSFESAPEEDEDDSEDLIYDEAIPDGDEVLLVNPRRASDVSANCGVTTETVASYRYEISMLSPEGEALQPPEGETVTLAFDLPEASDESLDVRVVHLPASGAQEELPARVEGGTVYAETTGFSAFVVEFTRTERRYTATSSVPTPVKNIVDSVVTEEKNLYVVYVSSSHPNLVKAYKDMDIWFVEAPWVFDETVTLTVGTSPWEGDVSPTNEYTITVKSHMPGVPYRKLGETLECVKYTPMSTIKEQMGMTLKDGWYIVDKDVTFENHRLTVLGDVHLILRDGCTLTCKYGIRTATQVDPKTALTVYAEDKGTGLLRCEVNYDRGTRESFYAGIGGNRGEDGGVITVYGGEIKAVGAIQGSGIGGGTDGNLRGFTMYDGSVTVKGKKGAGIGGGKGGTITGPIVIHGGLVTAKSLSTDQQDTINYSAAIGAGEGKNLGADIIIDGGVVIAHASNGGPGIGDSGITSGGRRINDNGAVIIKGGHVIASGTDGAGIGAGMNGIERGGTGCTVNISGGFVEAVSSKRGAGIGGSYKGNGGIVNISGGYVIARGTDLQVPFGHGHKWITAEKQNSAARAGLEVIANLLMEAFTRHEYGGAGIGGGDGGNGGTVTISGGTVLAASGSNGSHGIGHGMEGESNGTATITDDYARIRHGTSMDKLCETMRKDSYGWNSITREKRNAILTFSGITYISACEHGDMVYRQVDKNYHEHCCNTCLYYERAEAHDFDEKGICRKCLYNRNDKPVEYDIWYLGNRVTSENMEKMHYDPFTHTLTIPKNVDWTLLKPLTNDALIYAEGDLTIDGNAWLSPKDNPAKYGVYVKNGTVTFKADSNLSFSAGEYGIYAPGGINIENVKALGFTAREGGTGVYFGDKPPVINENVGIKIPEYGKASGGAIADKDGKKAAAVSFVRGLTLSFDANGAVGTPTPMKGLVKNREYTLPEGKPRRQNYDFLYWSIDGSMYDAGMSFSISEDTTAKAVWQEHAHSWKAPIWEWKQDENGNMLATALFVCSECNELSQVAASVFANTTKAACEKPGSIRYLASVRAFGGDNGEYNDSRTVTLPAIGHDWGEWKTTAEPTAENPGEMTRVCKNDSSHVEQKLIPQLHSHSLIEVARSEPICVRAGNIRYWKCTGCGEYFADAEGKTGIGKESVILPATGTHQPTATTTVTKEATCTERGEYQYRVRCKDCGQLLEGRNDWNVPLGHDWGDWTVTREASETQEGEETRTCKRDASHVETRVIPRAAHVHRLEKTEAAAATCMEPGNIAYWTCTGCGRLFADSTGTQEIARTATVVDPLGHQTEGKATSAGITKQPACTERGFERMEIRCTRCGEVISVHDRVLDPLGHDWGEWTVTKAATEGEEGSEQRVCARDESHIETRAIPRLKHVHTLVKTEGRQPSCTVPGSMEYWTCTGCGKLFADDAGTNEITQAETVIPVKDHTPKDAWDLTGSLAPTCGTEGLDTYVRRCSVCGAALETRTERTSALGHAWGAWTVTKPATEQETGIETRTCARCGKAGQHVIPKLAHRHSMTKTDAAAPGCTEPGNIAYWTCTGCGRRFADAAGKKEIYDSDIALPAKGHSAGSGWQLDAVTKQPGCTDQGYRRMKLYCSDCGEELSSRGESIAPLGHDWGEWETTLEPTETQEGRQTRVCMNDERHVEERTLPVLQHTHTLTAIPAQQPGCVAPGSSAYYRCSGCGLYFADAAGTKPVDPEDMTTAPLGHTAGAWSEGTVEKSPTCTEIGIRSYTLFCARCGEELTTRTERIPALGHAWGEWITDTQATEEAEGTEIRICAHDADHTETRAIPKLPHVHTLVRTEGTEPSCTEPGSITYWTCTGCGRLFTEAEGTTEITPDNLTLPPKGHTAADWVSEKQEPDCTTPGYVRFTLHCADCGETLSTRGDAIFALGHDWGKWETIKTPTETEDGEEQRICLHDPAHVQTRAIPALGHTHTMTLVPEKAASCTEEGSRAYYRCRGCGLCFEDEQGKNWIASEDTVIPPLGHKAGVWEEESSTAPGCTQPGVKTLALHCDNCTAILSTRSEIIPAAGHDWGKATYLWSDDLSIVVAERRCRNDTSHIQQEICDAIEIKTAVPASCEDEGVALYRALFENPAFDSEKTRSIPALGHKWGEWTVIRAATETEDGEQTRVCENDPTHSETAVIPSITHVHKLTAVPEKKPGCTEEGNIAYWICESCDSVFTDAGGENEVEPELYDTIFLAPLGHDWQRNGEAVWTDDRYSAVLRFVCRHDTSHICEALAEAQLQPEIILPTREADGSVTYTVAADLEGKTYTEQLCESIARPGYTYSEETETWTRGSGKSAVFRVVRGNGSDDVNHDKLTMELFTGIEIDGRSVTADHYSAEKGSVIVTIKSEYLETLSDGEHSLTVNFGDGAVTTRFLIAAAPDPLPFYYSKEDVLTCFGRTAPALREWEDDTDTLFLGWYADAEFSGSPIATETDIPETGAYARYIPANALALGIQFRTNSKTGDPNKTDLRFVTSVPEKSLYSKIGFDIDYKLSGAADYSDLADAQYSDKIYSDYIWQTVEDQVTKFEVADAVRLLGANALWSKNLTCCAVLGVPNKLYLDGSTPVETDFRVTLYLVTKDGVRSEIKPKEFYITWNGTKPVPAKRS